MENPPSKHLYEFIPYRMLPVEPYGNKNCAQKLPKPRSGHRCVANDGHLYSFGGYNPQISLEDEDLSDDPNWPESKPLFRELWKFNFATKCWIKLQTTGFIPQELASHSALLCGHYLLIYGGTGVPFGHSSSNKLHFCDLRTLQWGEVETTGESPLEQYGQAVTSNGNQMYVVGGTTGYEYSIDVHRLDMVNKTWEELTANCKKPRKRYRHEIAHHSDHLFVFGGGTAAESFPFRELPCFNLKLCIWHRVVTKADYGFAEGYPAARRCHSLVHMDESVYICGGYDGEEIFADVWRLNLNTFQWKLIVHSVPRPTYFHSAAVAPNGCMYVYGGVTNVQENARTSDICKVWLKIASLKEMCWEAMLFYWPHLPYVPRITLHKMGIPSSFVDRIQEQAECG